MDENENDNTFGYLMNIDRLSKELKKARKKLGITQKDAAKILEVSTRTFQRIEGKVNNFGSEFKEKSAIKWINETLGTKHKTER